MVKMFKYINIIFNVLSFGTIWYYGSNLLFDFRTLLMRQIQNNQETNDNINNIHIHIKEVNDNINNTNTCINETNNSIKNINDNIKEVIKETNDDIKDRNNLNNYDFRDYDLNDHLLAIFKILSEEDKKEKALELFNTWNDLFPEYKIE